VDYKSVGGSAACALRVAAGSAGFGITRARNTSTREEVSRSFAGKAVVVATPVACITRGVADDTDPEVQRVCCFAFYASTIAAVGAGLACCCCTVALLAGVVDEIPSGSAAHAVAGGCAKACVTCGIAFDTYI